MRNFDSRPLFAEDSPAAQYFKEIERIIDTHSFAEKQRYANSNSPTKNWSLLLFMEEETNFREAQDASPTLNELYELLKKQETIYRDRLCELKIIEKELEMQAKIFGQILSLFRLDMPDKIIPSMDTTFGKYVWRQVFDDNFLSALESYVLSPTEEISMKLQRFIARRSKEVNISSTANFALTTGIEKPTTLSDVHTEIIKLHKNMDELTEVFMFLGEKMARIKEIAGKDF